MKSVHAASAPVEHEDKSKQVGSPTQVDRGTQWDEWLSTTATATTIDMPPVDPTPAPQPQLRLPDSTTTIDEPPVMPSPPQLEFPGSFPSSFPVDNDTQTDITFHGPAYVDADAQADIQLPGPVYVDADAQADLPDPSRQRSIVISKLLEIMTMITEGGTEIYAMGKASFREKGVLNDKDWRDETAPAYFETLLARLQPLLEHTHPALAIFFRDAAANEKKATQEELKAMVDCYNKVIAAYATERWALGNSAAEKARIPTVMVIDEAGEQTMATKTPASIEAETWPLNYAAVMEPQRPLLIDATEVASEETATTKDASPLEAEETHQDTRPMCKLPAPAPKTHKTDEGKLRAVAPPFLTQYQDANGRIRVVAIPFVSKKA